MNRPDWDCQAHPRCGVVLFAAITLILATKASPAADPTSLTSPVATLHAVDMGLRFTDDPYSSRLVVADWSGPVTVWDWRANTTRTLNRESVAIETTATTTADSVDRMAAFALTCTAAISDDKKLYIEGNSLYVRPYIGPWVSIASLATHEVVRTLSSSNPRHSMDEGGFAQFIDSQNNVVTCCSIDGLCLWDFANGRRKGSSHSDYSVMCGGVIRDMKTLRFWGSRTGYPGFRLFDWNWETDVVAVAPGCPEDLFQDGALTIEACFSISPDGKRIVFPGPRTQRFWIIRDIGSEGSASPPTTKSPVKDYRWDPVSAPRCLTFSSDGQYLAAGDLNNVVRIWRLPTPDKTEAVRR